MAKIPVGCRVEVRVAQDLDLAAQHRGQSRAEFIAAAIAHELGQDGGESLPEKMAGLSQRVERLENILLSMAGAIARL